MSMYTVQILIISFTYFVLRQQGLLADLNYIPVSCFDGIHNFLVCKIFLLMCLRQYRNLKYMIQIRQLFLNKYIMIGIVYEGKVERKETITRHKSALCEMFFLEYSERHSIKQN